MTIMSTLLALLLMSASHPLAKVTGQVTVIREVPNRSRAAKPAPASCVAVFRTFFTYLQKQEPSILSDKQAQNRWLSRLMRTALAKHIEQSGNPKENPDYPSNQSFVGVWDKPTTFSIIGSRHYDYRNVDNLDDNRAVIDVLYEWSKSGGPNNNYPGEKMLRSFIFVFEDGAWKLEDVYTYSDKYATPESLRAYFEKK
jgi:hypothetical protein